MRAGLVAIACVLSCGDGGPGSPIEIVDETGVTTTSVELPRTVVGQSSSLTLAVVNSGGAQLGPLRISIAGEAASELSFDPVHTTCLDAVLEPAGSCDLAIVFRPLADGARRASLVIATPTANATLEMVGVAMLADLRFEPASLGLGAREIGTLDEYTIELRNHGLGPTPIESIAVTGLGYAASSSTCGLVLAPMESCRISFTVDVQQLGAQDGAVSVTSVAQSYRAPVLLRGARRITVARTGNGSGRLTSTPPGLDCGTSCTALFEGDVELHAVADAGSELVSWSVPGCGTAASCTVLADASPALVTASFALDGASTLAITFDGDASGEVMVWGEDAGAFQPLAICSSSCSVPVPPNKVAHVVASTPSQFAGITGACSTPAPGPDPDMVINGCSFTAPAGTSAVTARFEKVPTEQWTRVGDAQLTLAAFDSVDYLIVGAPSTLSKLSPVGETVWSQVRSGVCALAIGPQDAIYVLSNTELVKLASDGSQVWTRPVTGCVSGGEFERSLAVAPDGAAAVHVNGALTHWDASGTQTWVRTIPNPRTGVAFGSGGEVLAAAQVVDPGPTGAVRYSATGDPLASIVDVTPGHRSMFVHDASGTLYATSSGSSRAYLDAPTFERTESTFLLAAPTGISVAGTGDVAWAHWLDDADELGMPRWVVRRHANDGSLRWEYRQRRLREDTNFHGAGVHLRDVAASPTGRIALVGTYKSTSAALEAGWVQVYQP